MKIRFKPRGTWVTNNFWLKLISLILAIAIWFYISGELGIVRLERGFPTIYEFFYNRSNLADKKVSIVLNLEGKLLAGCVLQKDAIKIISLEVKEKLSATPGLLTEWTELAQE